MKDSFSALEWDDNGVKLPYRLFSPVVAGGAVYPLVVFLRGGVGAVGPAHAAVDRRKPLPGEELHPRVGKEDNPMHP
jgi:predicted peptidase